MSRARRRDRRLRTWRGQGWRRARELPRQSRTGQTEDCRMGPPQQHRCDEKRVDVSGLCLKMIGRARATIARTSSALREDDWMHTLASRHAHCEGKLCRSCHTLRSAAEGV